MAWNNKTKGLFLIASIFICIFVKEQNMLSQEKSLTRRRFVNSTNSSTADTSRWTSTSLPHDLPTNNSNSTWLIIAFTTTNYLPAAKIWYNQLTKLGYTSHQLVALDTESLKILKNENFRSFPAKNFVKISKYWDQRKKDLKNLFKIRLETINDLIVGDNLNVLVSDVDSIWLKYVDLEKEMSNAKNSINSNQKNIDIYHSYGTVFPKFFHRTYGFVLCGCVTAYKSTKYTKKLFSILMKICEYGCDDQRTINSVYKDSKIWFEDMDQDESKMTHKMKLDKIGQIGPKNIKNTIQELNSKKPLIGLKIATWAKNFVSRGIYSDTEIENYCQENRNKEGHLWIVSPVTNKNIEEKMSLFEEWGKCVG